MKYNMNALRIEGEGSAYTPRHTPAKETCSSNPFGSNSKGPIYEALHRWLSTSMDNRMSEAALHNLSKDLGMFEKGKIKEQAKQHFVGTARHEIAEGLIRCGIFQRSKKVLNEKASVSAPKENVRDLLSETLLYIPEVMSDLRARISLYLRG